MSWDLSLLAFDGPAPSRYPSPDDPRQPMGTVAEVTAVLKRALPALRFYQEPAGAEKLRLMQEAGITDVPDIIREFLERRGVTYAAEYEGKGFSVSVLLGEGPEVKEVHLEVRGGGDASGVLQALGNISGWALYNCMTSSLLPAQAIGGSLRSAQAYLRRGISEVRRKSRKRGGA